MMRIGTCAVAYVYLLVFPHISCAVVKLQLTGLNVTNEHDPDGHPLAKLGDTAVGKPLQRAKRWWFFAFIAVFVRAAAIAFARSLGGVARLGIRGRPPPRYTPGGPAPPYSMGPPPPYPGKRSAQSSLESIQAITNDYDRAMAFKNSPQVQGNPVLRDMIIVDRNGVKCDAKFCRRNGDGQGSIGLCTMAFCHCANGIAYPKSCGTGTVYDPFHEICNWPYNIEFCN